MASYIKVFYLFLAFSSLAWGQQEYFTAENKQDGLEYYKNLLYRGCADLKEKQDPVSPKEMERLINETVWLVQKNFSRAFEENPKIKEAFLEDLREVMKNPYCQKKDNDCRAKILGHALFYYHRLRPDIPGCKDYRKTIESDVGYNGQCELELKYRKRSFQGVRDGTYGLKNPGTYKKLLIDIKNDTTLNLFRLLIHKDNTNLHICNSVQNGNVHRYALEIDDAGDYFAGVDPKYDPRKNIPKECVDEKVILHSEFFSTAFDIGRTTVGEIEVDPVKSKVLSTVKGNAELIVTDIEIFSSSSKTPFYKVVAGKKMIDPESNDRNLSLSKQRAQFAEKVFKDLKSQDSKFKYINISVSAGLAGPDFIPTDLNDRFVTRMTPGYVEKLDALFNKHEKLFTEGAIIKSAEELLDEKKFSNLYQAKFKPFQGFRLLIRGYKKEDMKCLELGGDETTVQSRASKQ